MRGLEMIMGSQANERPKKTASKRIHPDRQTDIHPDSMTKSALWSRFSENKQSYLLQGISPPSLLFYLD